MPAVHSLLELQHRFLAALYDRDASEAAAMARGAGIAAESRVRIYRNAALLIHTDALRTAFPAVLALGGEKFFEAAAMLYRRAHPSTSGNLQTFGAFFGDFLEDWPSAQAVPYLADVARLEWFRQEAALAADEAPASVDQTALLNRPDANSLSISLHPSVRLFASRHAVLTVWRYAMAPTNEGLQLPSKGEQVAVWRRNGEVAMAGIDTASFACIDALSHGVCVAQATGAAKALDPDFDGAACLESLVTQELVAAIRPTGNAPPTETIAVHWR